MAVPNDATGEGQSDSPPLFLGRESRVEDLVPNLARDSRPVVRDANAYPALRQRLRRYLDPAVAPRQRVDGVLRQRLQGPLEKHGVALNHQITVVRRAHGHTLRESGNAGAEVSRDAIHQPSEIDRLLAWRTTDTLESVGNAFQSLQVRF